MNEDNPPSVDGGNLLSGVNRLIIYSLYLCIMDNRLRVLRRLDAVENIIKYRLDQYDEKIDSKSGFNICYDNEKYFFLVVSQWTIAQMYYNHFSDIDDTSEEWKEIYDVIEKYIDTLYGKTIRDFYNDRCG